MSSELEQTQALVVAAHGGDQAAYDELFARYYPVAVAMAESRLGRRIRGIRDAEDVALVAMAEVFDGLDSFEYRSPASFRNYLSKVIANRVIDASRRERAQKRDVDRVRRYGDLGLTSVCEAVLPGNEPTPSQNAHRGELEQRVLQALSSKLPELYREVILLRDLGGMSYDEIAEQSGLKVSTVRSQHARAVQMLCQECGLEREE